MYEVRGTIYEVRCTRFDLRFTRYDVRGSICRCPKVGAGDFELAGEPAARQGRRVNPPEILDAVWNCRGRPAPPSVLSTDGGGVRTRADGLKPRLGTDRG